ncbi:SRP19 domain-containing protein [Rhizoctonia solani AG-1 IA]|uniref:SRP19 domain-containing protein n=1 Tax=Thanatephorus cucumeris (strain AG1-IA) TaxID=983506 RepID=L8X5K8_THACA|nr:SRP19 domain-containing protein [Rhizoctonia solani AG-1 IA]
MSATLIQWINRLLPYGLQNGWLSWTKAPNTGHGSHIPNGRHTTSSVAAASAGATHIKIFAINYISMDKKRSTYILLGNNGMLWYCNGGGVLHLPKQLTIISHHLVRIKAKREENRTNYILFDQPSFMASRQQRTTIQDVPDSDSDGDSHAVGLPNTGSRGALLQEIGNASDPDEPTFEAPVAGASGSTPIWAQHTVPQYRNTADLEKYKRWTSLYPIYFDAKRPYGQGQRRLAREKSIWWPQSRDIEVAARVLGIPTLHELRTGLAHEATPSRLGKPRSREGLMEGERSSFESKVQLEYKRLLEAIALQIQAHKPDQVPTPETSAPIKAPPKPTQATKSPKHTQGPIQRKSFKVPQAPQPWPKLQDRVSPYSPMIDGGIYVDAVSNALAAEKKAETGPGAIAGQAQGQAQAGAGAGKGKKKVIRVRG